MSDQTETTSTKEPTTAEAISSESDTDQTPATAGKSGVTRTRVRTRQRRVTRRSADDVADVKDSEQEKDTSEPADTRGNAGPEANGEAPSGGTIRRRRRRRTTAKSTDEPASTEAASPSDKDADAQTSDAHAAKTADDDKAEGEKQSGGQKKSGGRKKGHGANDAKGNKAKGSQGKGAQGKGSQGKGAKDKGAQRKDAPGDETSDDASSDEATSPAPSRAQAARTRGRSGRGRGKGRKPVGTVSEATRRAINEGPPRRMMVTVGEERTQIAVLEQRTLMEHYVTRKADVSYVGNIYLGRVQNVLPGMEAAFVDIGKGRNGVLYAGEVNYDEADLEGEVPRIEEQLKPGQTVLVQVTKDPMGTKGARLTQQLSLAGRFCVLAPGDGMLGISRKLPDAERDRLRKILKDVKPDGYGLIVRTAAEDADADQLKADVDRLVRKWDAITKRADEAKPLEAVYTEPNLVIRVIRDIFGPEYTELVVDNDELAGEIKDYLGDVSPEMVPKVQVHTSDEKLFDDYEISTQIRRALEKKVWLKSGGYLIIEKTEAMWVIDVNTGKFVGKDNLEETVLKNNLEAAEEIAHQLRLRDMGGIIVIDFVDMMVSSNRDEVLKRFKRELARDKTKSRVMDISKLGLVQMTRKNVSHGLTETFTSRCETCEGRGATIAEDFS